MLKVPSKAWTVKVTVTIPLCLFKIWRTVTLLSALKWCPLKPPSYWDYLGIKWLPTYIYLTIICFYGKGAGTIVSKTLNCSVAPWVSSPLLSQTHFSLPEGSPYLQNQDSATAWQKPESHILNESDHSLGVHLYPTAQMNLLWSHCVSAMVTTALPQACWGGNRPKQLGGCSCWDEKGCLWHQAKWIQFPQLLNDKDFRDTTPSLWRIAGYRTGGEEVSLIQEEGWLLRLSSLLFFFFFS